VLTPAAVAFVEDLTRRFRPRIEELLIRRRAAQQRLDNGERLDFLSETAEIRRSDWRVAPIPDDLRDRRVEITGPVDRKMISCSFLLFARASPLGDQQKTSSPELNSRDAVGSAGSGSFTTGTAITLSVSNGRDATWSGACSSGDSARRTCTFTIAGTASVTANVR
jgi:malate synthase